MIKAADTTFRTSQFDIHTSTTTAYCVTTTGADDLEHDIRLQPSRFKTRTRIRVPDLVAATVSTSLPGQLPF